MLLPLGISVAAYQRAHAQALEEHDVELWQPGAAAAAAREAVQQRYPTFAFDLARTPLGGGASLLDRLAYGDLNLWWLLETSEKSVFRCSLVNHIYFLELISRAVASIAPTELWVSVRSGYLERTLRSCPTIGDRPIVRSCRCSIDRLRPRAPFAVRLLARRLVLFSRLLRQYVVLRAAGLSNDFRSTRIVLHANYPSMWIRGTGDAPQDRHYGVLADVLNRWKRTGYVVHLQLPARQLWRLRARIGAIWRQFNIVPLLQFTGVGGVCGVLTPGVLLRLMAVRRAVRRGRFSWGAWNVSAAVEGELDAALEHNELPLNLLWIRGLRRLFRRQPIDFVVHSGEFQPFEKAIWYAAREHRVSTVSFQHSTASPMFLSYHFAPGELPRYLTDPPAPSAMPLPTLFATTGEYAAEALVRAGFPAPRVSVCGPIRYHSLIELRSERRSTADARRELGLDAAVPVVLVATTSKRADNLNMMRSLAAALQRRTDPVAVVMKPHPQVTRADERELAAFADRFPPAVRWRTFAEERPLSAMLAAADVLVTNSSATGVEAMALGVVPIFFHNPHLYDVSILYSLPNSVLFATNGDELSEALDEALSGDAARRLTPHWADDVRRLFGPLDTEAEQRLVTFMQRSETPLPATTNAVA